MATPLRKSIFLTGVVFCLIGWLGAVFGPVVLIWFGAAGFLCAFCGGLGLPMVADDLKIPQTTSQHRLKQLSIIVGIAAFVFFGALMASARLQGGASAPAFEEREVYYLENGDDRVEVSRTRFMIASASFSTTWTLLAIFANLTMLRRVVGEVEITYV